VAALLGERSIEARGGGPGAGRAPSHAADATGSSDLLALIERFEQVRLARFDRGLAREIGIDWGGAKMVSRARDQLLALCQKQRSPREPLRLSPEDEEQAILVAILAGYPDRVARRRSTSAQHAATSAGNLAFADGGTAVLSPESVVRVAPLLVAVDAEERRGAPAVVRLASAIEPEFLIDLYPERIRDATLVVWNEQTERVDATNRVTYEGLVLDESRTEPPEERAAAILAEAALARGPRAFVEDGLLDRWLARARFVASLRPNFHAPSDEDVRSALRDLCTGRRSFAELRQTSLVGALHERLSTDQASVFAAWAPERARLRRGREVRIEYEADKAPFIASRLQDFFGMQETPRIGGGAVSLVVHLLAPNQRAVQVTSDLAGFWQRHYPQLRRELGRRYPRHAWPEDPMTG
jgi:ATP-dependent helicase HrpB